MGLIERDDLIFFFFSMNPAVSNPVDLKTNCLLKSSSPGKESVSTLESLGLV